MIIKQNVDTNTYFNRILKERVETVRNGGSNLTRVFYLILYRSIWDFLKQILIK